MKSWQGAIEPPAQPRLAAIALLIHLFAAAFPWITRCPPWLAAVLSVLAMIGLVGTLARIPGPHCRMRRLSCCGDEWRVRLAGSPEDTIARLASGTRIYAGLIVLELKIGRRRLGWILPRGALGPREFRQLKARVRMAC